VADSKTVILLMLAVVASGCTSIPNFNQNSDDEDLGESTGLEGKGVEIVSTTVSDNSLSSGQTALMTVEFRNHLPNDQMEISQLRPYNLGQLDTKTDSFEPYSDFCTGLEDGSRIPEARNGLSPKFSCTWEIEAPSREEMGDFESKSYNPRVRIEYDSRLSNGPKPVKLRFEEDSEIEKTEEFQKEFSNGEVRMTISGSRPVPDSSQASLDMKIDSTSDNGVVSRQEGHDYKLHLYPEKIFSGPENSCRGDLADGEDGNVADGVRLSTPIEEYAQVTCTASSDNVVERNIIMSVSYKYQQSSNVNVVVNK